MKQTNNFYPKTWLKKFWNLTFTKSWDFLRAIKNKKGELKSMANCIEYVVVDNNWMYDDVLVYTNKHYKILNIKSKGVEWKKANVWLLISLWRHQKKWGLIAR